MSDRRVGVAVLATVLTLLAACSSGATQPAASSSSSFSSGATVQPRAEQTGEAAGLPRPDHVVVVIFENEDARDVVGAAEAPYLTELASAGASFTDAHAETHPSQPNYLALFSGSTQGVDDDSCPQTLSGPTLASELLAAGHTFVGYSEGLPKAGFTGCTAGRYARKHNPWVNFADLPSSVNQPFTALPADWSALPTVSFVVPDLCNDMHDCGVAAGDRWARDHLPGYLRWATAHNSLLVVTFDEDDGSKDNHIATTIVGAGVRPGPSDQRIDHYSLLRTFTDMYGLAPIGQAGQRAPITGIWGG